MPTPQPVMTVQGHGANPPPNLERLNRFPDQVPPSLDPNILNTPVDFVADEFVLQARGALHDGQQAATRALELAKAILADETMTTHKRHQLCQEKVEAAVAGARDRMQSVINKLADKLTAMDAYLLGPKPVATPAGALQVAEARRVLAELPAAERRQIVLKAIADGDLLTGQATTRIPSYLLGPSANDLEVAGYAEAWAARECPDIVERTKALRTTYQHLTRGGQLLISFSSRLASTQIAAEARRLHQRTVDAAKAAGVE